jgi:hypothetical protein
MMFAMKIFNQFNTITMSTTANKKTAPKAKRKGPMAIAFEKITALQELVADLQSKPHECKVATLAILPQTRQYTGRVTMPTYGVALPAGIGFHGYVKVRLLDDVVGNQVLPPDEADVLSLLRLEAAEQFPGNVKVEVSDISVLPAGWGDEYEEE